MNPLKLWLFVFCSLLLLAVVAFAAAGFVLLCGWLVSHPSIWLNALGWLVVATTAITFFFAD